MQLQSSIELHQLLLQPSHAFDACASGELRAACRLRGLGAGLGLGVGTAPASADDPGHMRQV